MQGQPTPGWEARETLAAFYELTRAYKQIQHSCRRCIRIPGYMNKFEFSSPLCTLYIHYLNLGLYSTFVMLHLLISIVVFY